jgi:hypothetical protein
MDLPGPFLKKFQENFSACRRPSTKWLQKIQIAIPWHTAC